MSLSFATLDTLIKYHLVKNIITIISIQLYIYGKKSMINEAFYLIHEKLEFRMLFEQRVFALLMYIMGSNLLNVWPYRSLVLMESHNIS